MADSDTPPTLGSRPAARAVPPGRGGYDLAADRLLLHTFTTREAFEDLGANGVLRADPSRAEPDFAAPTPGFVSSTAAGCRARRARPTCGSGPGAPATSSPTRP